MSFDLKVDLDFIPKSFYLDGNIKFDPPIYSQRYCFVSKVLGHNALKDKIKKVIDFGCAEMRFFNTIRYNLPGIEHVVEIDIDEELLKRHSASVKPLLMNYFNQRTSPLKVEVYKGSIATKYETLLNTDALVAIELIEHLTPDVLKDMPEVIFDYMRPKLAIFTTPNSEANVLFPDLEGFRHWDHKFEWTRAEFEKWANDVCTKYPSYSVQFYQIGVGPPETQEQNFGGVSQCAIFLCKEFVNDVRNYRETVASVLPDESTSAPPQPCNGAILDETIDEIILAESNNDQSVEKSDESSPEHEMDHLELGSPTPSNLSGYSSDDDYTLILSVEYPFTPDDRTETEKILDECKYQIGRMSRVEKYIDEDRNLALIPLETLLDFIYPVTKSLDQLRHVLTHTGYKIVDNDVIEVSTEEDADDGLESSGSENYSSNEEEEEEPQYTANKENETWVEECWD